MVAVRNYVTDDRTVLSFHKGDIIRLQKMEGLEEGEAELRPSLSHLNAIFRLHFGKLWSADTHMVIFNKGNLLKIAKYSSFR